MIPRAAGWTPLVLLVALAACDASPTGPAPLSSPVPGAPSLTAGTLVDTSMHVVQLSTPLTTTRRCQWIGSGGGRVEVGPVRLDFPGDALSRTTEICVTVGGEDLEATFEPHGLTFPAHSRPRLRIEYRGAKDYVESSLTVVYSDPVTNEILGISPTQISVAEQRVEALLDHFSTWAMASN